MIISALLIIVGFALLIKGADFLVDGASNVAKRFHIPEIIIGLTIVSIGTSMPELFVSVTSALKGSSDMAMGNVIGSNVCNLLLILGLSAVIRPIRFKKETKFIEIPLNLAFTLLFMALCNSYQGISRPESIVLIGVFALFIIYTILIAKKEENSEAEENNVNKKENISIIKNILYIIIGVASLIRPITYNLTYNIDLIVLIISTIALFLFTFIPKKNEMNRYKGVIYLMMYAGYLVILFNK